MKRMGMKVMCAGLLLAVFVGCQPVSVINVADAPVTTPSGKDPSMEQVRKAIIEAGTSLRWTMADAGPGHLVATQAARGHQAVVDIKYNTKKYSITYKDSMNLKYDPALKTIHKNYNSWVENLDRAIKVRLSAVTS